MDFNQCTLHSLEKSFGLRAVKSLPALEDWLAPTFPLTSTEEAELLLLQEGLRENVPHWNEQELSLNFIGPIFALIYFTHPERKYNLFAQRLIAGEVPDLQGEAIRLQGKPDGLIASGYREPEAPYFAFQEFKKEQDPYGDPAGQALAAMLVGQAAAHYQHPLYGCYVVGQNWYFMALEDAQYSISPAYSALTDNLFKIFGALKALKAIINHLVEE